MKNTTRKGVSAEIDRILQMSAVCRGEWCRSLESEVDNVREEWNEFSGGVTLGNSRAVSEESRKIREAYRNLGPDIHV